MTRLEIKIDKYSERLEMGFLTENQSITDINALRSDIFDKYEQGSYNFEACISTLQDVWSLHEDMYNY